MARNKHSIRTDEDRKIANKTLNRIRRLPFGLRGEEFVNYFLAPWFSGYWAFPNPKHKGAEIADTLLLWGDVVFVIQIKERKGIRSDVRWARYKILEEKKRILEWVSRLKKDDAITLRNKYREIRFPLADIKWHYGLIVLNHYSEPYDANEFLLEDSDEQKVAIQVISLADLFHLLDYINTPWDLVNYFESRYRLSLKTPLLVHREDEVFSLNIGQMYHDMAHDTGKDEADKWKDFMDITIMAANRELKLGDQRLRRYASGFLIDASIGGALKKAPKNKRGHFIIDNEFLLLTKAVEVLSEMSRLRRSFYGGIFLNEAEEALASGNDKYEIGRSPKRERSYGFVATNRSGRELEEFLGMIAIKTLANHGNTEGIFVAAPPENIFSVYQTIAGWLVENKSNFIQDNEVEALRSTILYINLG